MVDETVRKPSKTRVLLRATKINRVNVQLNIILEVCRGHMTIFLGGIMVSSHASLVFATVLATLKSTSTYAFVQGGIFPTGCNRLGAVAVSRTCRRRTRLCMTVADEHDILLRVAKGEKTDRAPVWLMRQVSWFSKSDPVICEDSKTDCSKSPARPCLCYPRVLSCTAVCPTSYLGSLPSAPDNISSVTNVFEFL